MSRAGEGCCVLVECKLKVAGRAQEWQWVAFSSLECLCYQRWDTEGEVPFQTEAVHQTGESLSAVRLVSLDGRMMMPLLENFRIMLEEFVSGMGGLGELWESCCCSFFFSGT